MRPLQEDRACVLRDARLELLRDGKGVVGLAFRGGDGSQELASYILRPDRLNGAAPSGGRTVALHPVPARSPIFKRTAENEMALCVQDGMHIRAGFVSPWSEAWWSSTEDGRAANRRYYYALKGKARRITHALIAQAIEEAADPLALTVARRYPLQCRGYIYAAAATSSRARQLCETFPALAADIYSREMPPPAAALVERGASLKAVADTHGMPMVLRRVKPAAILSAFRCWRAFGGRPDLWHAYIPETLPAQRIWLRAVMAAEFLGPPYMEWVARNVRSFGGRTAIAVVTQVENIGDFVKASYEAQYLGEVPDYVRSALGLFNHNQAGGNFITRQFSPEMSLRTVQRLNEEWHEATILHSESNGRVRHFPEPWVPEAEIGGFTFTPITNSADLHREGVRMKNCVGTYGGKVLAGDRCIYSVLRDGKAVATLEIHRDHRGNVKIGQVREQCNMPAGKPVMEAARVWLRQSGVTKAPEREPDPFDRPLRQLPAAVREIADFDEEIPF